MPATKGRLRLAAPLLAWRALAALFVLFSTRLLPPMFDAVSYRGNFHWPADEPLSAATFFQTWDAQHYLFLSRVGWTPGAESVRFFPLWPLLIRAGAVLAGGHHLLAALLLANGLAVAGVVLFHGWCARRRGEAAADAATLLLLAFPGALFFGFPYSEALFFFLAIAFLDALDRKRWLVAGAAAFFLPLARAVGVVAAAPLLYELWASRRDRNAHLACLAACAAGVASYLLFMRWATGDAFYYFSSYASQNLIGGASLSKLFDLPGFLRALANAGSFHDPLDSGLDRLFFLVFLAACVRLWKTDKPALAFALPMGLIPAMSVSFWGYTRYLLAAPPVFLAYGGWFAENPEKKKGWLWLAAGALLALQAVLTFRHINNYWAG